MPLNSLAPCADRIIDAGYQLSQGSRETTF